MTQWDATNPVPAWREGDEAARPAEEVTAQEEGRVYLLPIRSLLAADSPRSTGLDTEYARQLAELEVQLPPILVHRSTMRVIDGVHRLAAARLRGQERIAVQLFTGSVAEAFVLAVELNVAHGLPLSQADRAAAAERIMRSCPDWSDRRIASVAGIGRTKVASLRRATGRDGQLHARVGRDGRTRPANAAAGRESAAEFLVANPAASLRQVAAASGVALGTARDVRERVRLGQDPWPAGRRRHRGSSLEPAGDVAPDHQRTAATREHAAASVTLLQDAALANLRRDPSLRLTEQGRTLLQLLSVHAATADGWSRLAGAVPAHRADAVAHAARQCASAWLHLADEIEHSRRIEGTKIG